MPAKEAIQGGQSGQQDIPGVLPSENPEAVLQGMRDNPPGIPAPLGFENDKFYRAGAAVYEMKDRLISSFPELVHLQEFPVSLLFKRSPKRGRKPGVRFTGGEARMMSAQQQLYTGYVFEIWLDEHLWQTCPDKRLPLLHHELMHCGVDESGNPAMREHDLQEFGAVVAQWGGWAPDVAEFLEAAESRS